MIDFSLLPLLLLAGMLITLSPCILPVLPVMASSGLAKHKLAPVFTGMGLAIGFALMGMLLHGLGSVLGLSDSITRPLFASLLVLFGLALVLPWFKQGSSGFFAPLAAKADQLATTLEQKPGGAFWLGLMLGAIWSPCAGPILGAALGLAGNSGSLVNAGVQMLVFGIGAALPLMAIAYLFAGSARRFLPKIAAGGEKARQVLGYSLLLVGLLILTGADQMILIWATDNLPDTWLNLITTY
ncbi:cytochrome c biogenesis CcdA family protein [Alishewanella sp. SMS8]|uniref:cytochrome c biogenesis CcdA family protein n=1 Tax=Alishewanella sp. SMS8 TaxID=2994676 RepID=UPI0027419764|nr:cytochrome c biogenesis CcdA family protein [Alishewanella sp. SMS8]MDP5459328.1 cytochrome c biogenesis CcdA family protein [Alishewanella sp. SMS8]